jgi:hypothetical protein
MISASDSKGMAGTAVEDTRKSVHIMILEENSDGY